MRYSTAGGVFTKDHPSPPPGMFLREAEGLRALAEATSLRVPEVLEVTENRLVLELLRPGEPDDVRLGEGLAELHSATADAFGFAHDTYCGATLQPNPWTSDWTTFYRDHRLRVVFDDAVARGGWGTDDIDVIERLLARLPDLLGDPEPPALIHGDLWGGNRFDSDTGPALVDPAVSYSHREAEIGMMTLFGGFGPIVFEAYEATTLLQPGWRERNGLYQLFHVLNHDRLFGGYRGQAVRIARRYL